MPAAQVTELFTGYVGALLAEHAALPAQNWRAKDCAVYLVVALTVRGRTVAAGATATNQLVSVSDFFTQQVGEPGIAKPLPFSDARPFCHSASMHPQIDRVSTL